MNAIDLIVGSCGGVLSAIDYSARPVHPDDAFELLHLYAHVHRFPEAGVDTELRRRMKSAVEEDTMALAASAMHRVRHVAQTWGDQFSAYKREILDMGLEEAESRAMRLWQKMDDAALAMDAIEHLLGDADLPDGFWSVYARIEACGLAAMNTPDAFGPVHRYIQRLRDAYLPQADLPKWVQESTLVYRSQP